MLHVTMFKPNLDPNHSSTLNYIYLNNKYILLMN